MDQHFISSLCALAEKYNAAAITDVSLEDGAVIISCDKGKYRFI